MLPRARCWRPLAPGHWMLAEVPVDALRSHGSWELWSRDDTAHSWLTQHHLTGQRFASLREACQAAGLAQQLDREMLAQPRWSPGSHGGLVSDCGRVCIRRVAGQSWQLILLGVPPSFYEQTEVDSLAAAKAYGAWLAAWAKGAA